MGEMQSPETVMKVKVLPRSSKNQILGEEGGALKIKLTASPVEGKANEALKAFLAKSLGLAKSHVDIISGKKSKMKSVRIQGLSMEEVEAILDHKLSKPGGGSGSV